MQTWTTGKPNWSTQLNQGMVSFSNQILLRQVDTYTTIIKKECVAQLGKRLVDEFWLASLETILLSVFSKCKTSADNSKRNIFPPKKATSSLYRCFHSSQIMWSINTQINMIISRILTLEIWIVGPSHRFPRIMHFSLSTFSSLKGVAMHYAKRSKIS